MMTEVKTTHGSLVLVKFPLIDFFVLSYHHDGQEEIVARGPREFVAQYLHDSGALALEDAKGLLASAPDEGGVYELGEVIARERESVQG